MSCNAFKETALEDTILFSNGKKRPNERGAFPVYGGNGILDYCNKYNSEGESLIIGRVGAYCGNVYLEKRNCWISDNAILGKVKSGYLSDFMYYKLVDMKLQNLQIGSTQPLLTQSILKKIKINVPCLNEQKAIANILSSLDEKIEINNQINKKLEEMAKAIFKQWFVDFEFPNEEGKPYKSSGGAMVESELGMIPERWRVGELNEIVQLSTKSVNPQKNPDMIYEHFSIPAFDQGKMPDLQFGDEIKSSKYVISNEVVLMSKLNPTTKRIWKPFPQTKNPVCSTEFMVYVPNDVNLLSFVYELINTDMFSEMLVSHATGSTGSRQRVKPRESLSFKLVLPAVEIMISFSEKIKSLHENISIRIIENQRIAEMRDTLLPKLMTGKIRVPVEKK